MHVPLIDAAPEDDKGFFVRLSPLLVCEASWGQQPHAENKKHFLNELPCYFSLNIDYPNQWIGPNVN